MKLILFILLCQSFFIFALARETSFEKIDSRNGLSSDLVVDFCQDQQGFVWVATEDGLNKCVEGKVEVCRFASPSSISYKALCLSADNTLWLGTRDNGIICFDPLTSKCEHITMQTERLKLSHNTVNDLITDSKGRIWIATPAGLNLYDPNKNNIEVFHPTSSVAFSNTYVCSIYEDSKGRIFVGTWGQSFFYYKESENRFYPLNLSDGSKAQKVFSFHEDNQGALWIGTWGDGLYKTRFYGNDNLVVLGHADIESESFKKESVFNIVYDIQQDVEGRLWIASDAGVGRLDDPKDNTIDIKTLNMGKDERNAGPKDIIALFEDDANSIWMGTGVNGVFRFDLEKESFLTFQANMESSQFGANAFYSFWEMDGKLYSGVQSLGFGSYDIDNGVFESYDVLEWFKGLRGYTYPINAVLDAHIDNENTWLLTRYKGLIQYNRQTHHHHEYTLHSWNDAIVNFLCEGEQIWLGNNDCLHLYTLDEKSDKNYYKSEVFDFSKDPFSVYGVRDLSCLYRDSRGRMWMSALKGGLIEIIEDAETTDISFKKLKVKGAEQLESVPIQTIYEDSKGNLWLGTIGKGLWVYYVDKDEILDYKSVVSVWGENIYAIQEDEYKHLWVSTNHGISCIDVVEGGVINYTEDDGLQGNIFIKNSAYKDNENNIYFGGYYGFNVIKPSSVDYNRYVPPLAFSELTIDNKKVNVDYPNGQAMTLNHKQRSFSVSFVALSYLHSENNHYAYILEGFDEEWTHTETGAEKVIYGRLAPGKYTFKVIGSNNNGVWNNDALELDIIIAKSPYKTLLAYTFYFLFIVLLFVVASIIWKRNFTIKQAYKEEQNERLRANKLNQYKLRFFTNISHELLTPLSVISSAIEQISEKRTYQKGDLKVIQRNTSRLMNLINQLLEFRKVETDAKKLRVAPEEVSQLLNSLEENFIILCDKKKIQFNVLGTVSKAIWIDADKIDKILHNLLSNAFKYTPKGGNVNLHYQLEKRQEREHLVVRVSDTGPGILEPELHRIFDRFYRVESTKASGGTGIGLAYTKALVELHKGVIGVSNNSDVGASFFFDIPVTKNAFSSDERADNQETDELRAAEFVEDIVESSDEANIQTVFASDHKLKILLVEDNTDMRTTFKNYLGNYYQVFEAEHGKKALELISVVNIDLIVSDVLMPEMNGIELCKVVKSDLNYCHIPVILTTAKRAQEDIMEGYEALADSYITKPVNMKMLQIRIDNILQQREQMKNLLLKSSNDLLENIDITDTDKELINKVNKAIKDNISNNEFTVSMLYQEVGSSESVVFRKMKTLTGLSPNQYIREVRLNRASQMLKKGIRSLEVCYQCGFTDPSYFSACFKKKFGVTPSKY